MYAIPRMYIRNPAAQERYAGHRKAEEPGCRSSEGRAVASRLYQHSECTTEDERGMYHKSVIFHEGAYSMMRVRGMGIVGEPCDMKKTRPEALFIPPPKPRAVLSAMHPSKDASRAQLRNFAESPSTHSVEGHEIAVQESIFTRRGVERIIRYAFEEAKARRGLLVGATKSNGISVRMPFFDEIFREISSDYPDVEASLMHADALAARLVLAPRSFDVVVGSNLFGDLPSEVTAAIARAIGIAPSANLNPEGRYPSLFEPIHGSVPDIAGQGTANPAGAIWAGPMMLDHA